MTMAANYAAVVNRRDCALRVMSDAMACASSLDHSFLAKRLRRIEAGGAAGRN